MNTRKKLLLGTSLSLVSVILVGMEHKEAALRRIKKSGYVRFLVAYVDGDMTLDNYRIDRMHTDLVTSRNNLYPGLALEILAGCNTDALFKNDADIDVIKLCAALIPLLESRHANRIDQLRVKRFLKKAVAAGQVTLEHIQHIEVPNSHIPLQQTVLYGLVDQFFKSESDSDHEAAPQVDDPVPAAPAHLELPPDLNTISKQELLRNSNHEPSYVPDQLTDTVKLTDTLSDYKQLMPLAIVIAVAAIAYKWWDSNAHDPDAAGDEQLAQEQANTSPRVTTDI